VATKGRNTRDDGRQRPEELARTAVQLLAELTGRRPETVLGLHKDEDGWKVTVEMVELSRVPNSTDLLGCYVVALDKDGDVIGYERTRRYVRGQASGDQQ
jgi:hypothetical protein